MCKQYADRIQTLSVRIHPFPTPSDQHIPRGFTLVDDARDDDGDPRARAATTDTHRHDACTPSTVPARVEHPSHIRRVTPRDRITARVLGHRDSRADVSKRVQTTPGFGRRDARAEVSTRADVSNKNVFTPVRVVVVVSVARRPVSQMYRSRTRSSPPRCDAMRRDAMRLEPERDVRDENKKNEYAPRGIAGRRPGSRAWRGRHHRRSRRTWTR